MTTANTLNRQIYSGIGSGTTNGLSNKIYLDIAYEQSIADDIPALVDLLNRKLLHGTMTEAMRSEIITAVTAQTNSNNTTQRKNRANAAIHLIITSPAFTILR